MNGKNNKAWLLRQPAQLAWLMVAAVAMAFMRTALAAAVPNTCEIHYPSDPRISWTCIRIGRHDTVTDLFASHWRGVLRFNRIDRRHIYPGVRIKVPGNLRSVHDFTPMPQRYRPAAEDAKYIVVNLTEQFLGAYAHGRLVMSFPIASGDRLHPTPVGLFRVTAYDRLHSSSLYDIEGTNTPYPMHYALRFFISPQGDADWIHGRDLPGYPASHGCIGLYDEQMQHEYYGEPNHPILEDARKLYDWVISPRPDDGRFHEITHGPPVLIIGHAPEFPPEPMQTNSTDRRGTRPGKTRATSGCAK